MHTAINAHFSLCTSQFEPNKAFRSTVDGVDVLYLHGAPAADDAKKSWHRLAVLREFLKAYKDAKLGALFVR